MQNRREHPWVGRGGGEGGGGGARDSEMDEVRVIFRSGCGHAILALYLQPSVCVVGVCVSARLRECVRVYVCVRAYVRAYTCACVCVRQGKKSDGFFT